VKVRVGLVCFFWRQEKEKPKTEVGDPRSVILEKSIILLFQQTNGFNHGAKQFLLLWLQIFAVLVKLEERLFRVTRDVRVLDRVKLAKLRQQLCENFVSVYIGASRPFAFS
jgi:hypothetical protein